MRRFGRLLRSLLLGLAILGVTGWLFLRPETVSPRVILTGGEVLTMSPTAGARSVEAVLVENGLITAVGALADFSDKDAQIYDLNGRVLTPGLIEPHTHPLATALLGAAVDVSGFTHSSRVEVMQTLRKAADGAALTPWLIAYGWDPVAIADLAPPSLSELDEIAPDRPMVVITQMLHEVFANSAAMAAASVPFQSEQHQEGVIRDENGKATGAFRELNAVNLILGAMPTADPAMVELLLRRQYAVYAKAGYTSIGITGAVGKHEDPVGLLRDVGHDDAPLRSFLYLLSHQKGDIGGTDDFKILGTKFWMDGSPFTGGAAFADAYEDTTLTKDRMHIPHGHLGPLTPIAHDFLAKVSSLQAKGHQIAVHAQGERALDAVLAAFEAAGPAPSGVTHRIEHNALITEAQIEKARNLGISLGFFVDHIYFYGDVLPQIVGERAQRYMPVAQAMRSGAVTTLHGDHPASPLDPLRTLRVAVERRSASGETVTAPDQALTREEALRAMTLMAAEQLGQGATLGSIEVGKRADFTLFHGDPLTADWQDLAIAGTWKDGQPVHTGYSGWLRLGPVWSVFKNMLF